jgi:MFS transporter, BCD family, chlorophyll transporter
MRPGGAATLVWMMMIAGFAVTAGLAGKLLDPYSPERLLLVTSTVSLLAFGVTLLALRGLEGHAVATTPTPQDEPPKPGFRQALAEVWREPVARRFTVFVFVSMLAYSAQDLILEPFAGTVFGYSPGRLDPALGRAARRRAAGMLLVALSGALAPGSRRCAGSVRCAAGPSAAACRLGPGLAGLVARA